MDIGIWGKYTASGAKYTGLFRDASDSNMWKLFATTGNSHTSPGTGTTINTTSGFTYANLTVGALTGVISTAAQPNITSLGTLSSLVVDTVTINGSTITTSADMALVATGNDISVDTDNFKIFSSGSNKPLLTIEGTEDAEGNQPELALYKNSASQNYENTGLISWNALNNASEKTVFSRIMGEIWSNADGSEKGKMTAQVMNAGTQLNAIRATADANSTSEVDIHLAAGAGSTTTIAGNLAVTTALSIGGTAIVAQATASAVGGVELATAAEVLTGTDAARVVTADTLAAKSVIGVIDVSSLTDDHIVTLTHNLGTADVIVEMYDIVTDQTVYADVYRTAADLSTASTSVISVQFGATAPTNDINCLITSVKGATAAPTVAYT